MRPILSLGSEPIWAKVSVQILFDFERFYAQNLSNHSSNTWGAFHLGKMSGWKFRKHSGSNGKALFARVNQKSNKMDVVALPGTLLQFQRRKWNFFQKLNNFDFVAIAEVCCCFVRRDINRVQNYLESTDADAILNNTIRNGKKNCDRPWTTLTGKHWKWRENSRRQPPAETQLRKWIRNFCSKSHFISKNIYLFDSLSRSYRN